MPNMQRKSYCRGALTNWIKIDSKKKPNFIVLRIEMSEPQHVVIASIEALLRRTIYCDGSCPKCRGTRPGCKTNPDERIRREINDIIQTLSLKYSRFFKRNVCTLFFIFRVGQNHFLPYGSKMLFTTATEKELLCRRKHRWSMEQWAREVCEVDFRLERLFPRLFPRFQTSRANMKLLCEWMEDDFPFVERRVLKKMLMISLSLGFLTKRLVGPLTFLRVKMFHSIFKQTLVRKKNSPLYRWFDQPFRDEDFLNVLFQKIRPRFGW